MTVKRDLKKRVRARQSRTGERYTTALQEVLAGRPGPGVPVVELVDLTAVAAEVGLKGKVGMFPDLAGRIDGRVALERIRDVLLASSRDPATRLFRAVLVEGELELPEGRARFSAREAILLAAMLYGQALPARRGQVDLASDGWRFVERARAGLAGVSDSGLMMAVPVPAREGLENVVCLLWGLPVTPAVPWVTRVVLRSARTLVADVPELETLIERARGIK
jgi:hypothetical protein